MLRAGRLLVLTGVIGYLAVLSLSIPGLRDWVNSSAALLLVVNVLAAIGAISLFVCWGMALYHWGSKYRGDMEGKRRWGWFLALGLFVGGAFYWLLDAGGEHPSVST